MARYSRANAAAKLPEFDALRDSAAGAQAAFEALAAQRTLLVTRDFLHHADAAHRHEVAPGAEAIGAFDGKVVDADLHDGVGKLSRGDGHLARRNDFRILGSQQLRALDRDALRGGKRQRVGSVNVCDKQ